MNQIVIITGGNQRIGFAAAKKFLSCGDKVIILGVTKMKPLLRNSKKKERSLS